METGFVKIRRKDVTEWEDRENSYHYGTNVNRYSHIKPGVKFILETKIGRLWHFVGYGEFGEVNQENDTEPTTFRATYATYTEVEPTPNTLSTRIIKELGFQGPMAYIQASILSISQEIYTLAKQIMDAPEFTTAIDTPVKHRALLQFFSSKLAGMTTNIEKSSLELKKWYRESFPYLSQKDANDKRWEVKQPSASWIKEDTIHDTMQPRTWACVKEQELIDKGQCTIDCEYSPSTDLDKRCKSNYGALWYKKNSISKFSPIYLDVVEQQILDNNTLSFDDFGKYFLNRDMDIPVESKAWLIETFNFTDEELLTIFGEGKQQRKNYAPANLILKDKEKLILSNLQAKGQVILYGPPGTGKTFTAKRIAKYLTHPALSSNIKTIQFHSNYSYEEFLEGLYPEERDGQVVFSNRPGHLKQMVDLAKESQDTFCLIIDEINRANLTKVMGELMYALEYREEEDPINLSSSPEKEFYLPANLYIIGTMNTADRSLADIDLALRRRFRFIEMEPSKTILEEFYQETEHPELALLVIKFFEKINNKLYDVLRNRDLLIGHTYFMLENLNKQDLTDVLFYEIIPLLEEYFYQDREYLRELLTDDVFVNPEKLQLKNPLDFDVEKYLARY